MKKFTLKRLATITAVLWMSLSTQAADFVVGNISYEITDNSGRVVAVVAGQSKYTGNVTIPATVTNGGTTYTVKRIGNYAFEDCTDLTAVTLGSNIEQIGFRAFRNCTSLSDINWLNSIRKMEGQAFIGCTSLTKAELSSSLEEMDGSVFSDCINITTVTVNDGCAVIGENAFSDCTKLKSISIPNSVTTLGNNAFNGCKALTSAVVGNGVREITNYCFENCTALETVKLGNKLTKVGFRSFRNCQAMKSITVQNSDVPNAEEQSFTNYNATLYVPASSVALYKAHEIWGKFSQIMPIVEDLYLTIIQSEGGRVKMPVTKGTSYAMVIEAENGWKINTVTYDGQDVTEQVKDGVYTTPTMNASATIRVAFESTTNVRDAHLYSDVKVYGQGRNIVVANVEPGDIINVYTTNGMLVSSTVADSDEVSISVTNNATYIVKAGGKTLKIAL